MSRLLKFFPMLFCPLLLWAQSAVKITGRVLDADTNQPLPGANILVVGSALGAATDLAGRFELENLLNGQYVIRAGYIGYASQQQPVLVADGPPVDVLFCLSPKVLEGEFVQVTAERFETAAGITVLSRQDIARTQATHLGELLQTVPALHVQNNGGKTTVSIRGSRANQVLVLLDGVKLNDEATGEADVASIPLNAVERIEVRKGNAAEYGSGAIGGVINIVSRETIDNKLHLVAKTGSYGFFNIEPTVSEQWRQFSFLASYQSLRSEGDYPFTQVEANNQAAQGKRYNADVWSNNFFGRLNFSRSPHKISLRYQTLASERGNPGRLYYLTPYARSKIAREIIGLDYDLAFKEWHTQFVVNAANHRTESLNLRPIQADLPFGTMPVFHFKNELKTLDATARLDWQPNSWLAMRAGYEQKTLRYTDQNLLSPTASIVGEARDDAQAFFFKPDVEISALRLRFCLSPVVHFDQAKLNNGTTARTENRWTPSMSAFLSYGGSHYLYAKGSIGRAFRMPTFADLFYQDFRVQGKADLRPEKSLNREVGIGARLTAGGIWSFDAAVFRNTIQDMIVWRLGSFEFFRPYNTDAELIGEDYNFSYSTAGNFLRLNVGYSHLRPLNKDKNTTVYDKLLPYRPEHSVKASLDLAYAAWQTSLMYRGLGARFVTEANTKSMPAYAVLDWTFAWRLTTKKLAYQLEAAIFNLLDEQYQIIRDMPLPGREWRMGLQVSY